MFSFEIIVLKLTRKNFKDNDHSWNASTFNKRWFILSFPDFSSCEADIDYYAKRYDRDTRQWLLNDFDTWFCDSHESRAYVLLGDAAVGKSVMAAVIAQRAKNDGNMAAAYFCRHYDGTRRDPRYLLGTVAYQLRNCNSQYDKVVGGEAGIQSMLANAKLGVHELFTKLLEEPLSKCSSCKRKLVVIDALDEAEYWSREDFLDLIMNRFPLLPNWLVFFITSRPEDTVQSRLRTYNPCIRICAGNSGSAGFYQQHEQDIRRFLEKRINFSILSYSAEEITDKCNGMFLYAFYIAEVLQNPAQLDGDIFPENINDYFCKNFKRVYVKVGGDFYEKLFGCALVAPSPLPVSFISFLLQRENSSLDEQEVIDAVSQFVALRTTDKTFAFLHSLIPAWLTDEQKASRRLFVDRNKAKAYFKSIIVEFLNAFLQQGRKPILFAKPDLVNYILSVGFRFFCKCYVGDPGSSQTVFDCLTNYRFLQERIRSNRIGIYFLIEDLEFSVLDLTFDEAEKTILDDVCSVLKRDKYVIVGCPELLHSCLSNASKLAQEKIVPNKVSVSWMELCFKCPFFPTNSTLRDLDCGAFSHDRRLFAGGKGRCIFLYDARTFERVSGPAELMVENLSHLEFSPDDKFVFFGRLGTWFSVEEKRVVEITQFSGKSECYESGAFFDDGNYIAVRQKNSKLHYIRLWHIFLEWALEEFGLSREDVKNESFEKYPLPFFVKRALLALTLSFEDLNSQASAEAFELGSPVRDYIVRAYANIFEYQIWNVNTGRSVIEDMFSSQLKPFFYIWHIFPAIKGSENKICDAGVKICNVALLNAVYYSNMLSFPRMGFNGDHQYFDERSHPWFDDEWIGEGFSSFRRFGGVIGDLVDELFNEKSGKCSVNTEREDDESITTFPRTTMTDVESESITTFPINLSYFITNTPVECYNYILCDTEILSKDRRWFAKKCFREHGLLNLSNQENLVQYIKDVNNPVFTNGSNLFVYFIYSRCHNIYSFSLETGATLRSISGLYPVHCASEEAGAGFGYIFIGTDERRIVSLADFPWGFFRRLSKNFTKPVNVTFTSPDTIMLVCADGLYILWKIGHDDLLSQFDSDILEQNSSQKIRVKKCIFSHDGKLTATHQHCEILLFNGGKFISSVFKVVKECEHSVPCLAFSPDDSLLLFCIQKTNGDQSFYVFEVEIKLLSKAIVFPYTVHVDCCCFSLDNTRIFFCNASSVLILDYPPKYRSYESHAVPKSHYTASHTCSYCTVSSDNKLLACSISNEILIHPVNDPDTFCKVPQNHSGRIEFCKFLKGNCYLISYGFDGLVFLFDLAGWKSVAYVRCENIISMVVSPNEDKVVCLQSSGEVSIINLYGLKCRLSSNFQLPSNFRLQERSFKPQAMQIAAPPPVDTEFEQNDFVDFISYSEYSNSSEEDVSDENFSSDLSATHSDCRS